MVSVFLCFFFFSIFLFVTCLFKSCLLIFLFYSFFNIFKAIATESSLETAGCLQRTFAGDSQLKYMEGIRTKINNKASLLIFILIICINVHVVLNIST